MTREEKISYLQAGTDCVISESTSKEDLVKLLGIAEKCKRMEKARKPQIKEPDLAIFKLPLWKRVFDIIFSSMALLCLSPIFIITVIWIKLEDKGPAFYKSKRVGSNYKVFDFYKFRSMYKDAEARKKELMASNEVKGLMFKMEDDPRITKVGKFIRKTSIDELPQFWNVLRGDMSLVGTRPPTVDEFEHYEAKHKCRLSMTPGLTGLWQISGRSDIKDFDEVVRLDMQYIDNWSILKDIKILILTVKVVLTGRGSR
jgi:exopolysaccharide biosynthesis polyprenyl glycosylphosphotransferase